MTPTDPDAEPPIPPALAAWKRRMWIGALVLMPLGLLLILVGAAQGGGSDPMRGFLLGGAGTFLVVLGALCGKFAAAGPYPEALR